MSRYLLLILFIVFLSPTSLLAENADDCLQPGPVTNSTLSIYKTIVASNLKATSLAFLIWPRWKEEWKNRAAAEARFKELSAKYPPLKAIEMLETEGLAEYLVLQAGRPGAMSGRELIRLLEKTANWKFLRTKGSHQIFLSPAGKSVPIPVHGNQSLATGTIQSILKEAGLKWRGSEWVIQ